MKAQITKLITVKTIITIVCLALFVYVIVKGIVDGDYFKTVFTMVISFYFGTQVQKNSNAYNDALEEAEQKEQDNGDI